MKSKLAFSIVVFVLFTGIVGAGTIAELTGLTPGTQATVDLAVIISTTDLIADPDTKCFQIRDNTGAVTIYGSNAQIDAALAGFSVGSLIEITGTTNRRDGLLTLDGLLDEESGGGVSGFAVSGRTSTMPVYYGPLTTLPSSLADWNPAAEALESNLLCLQNVVFDDTGFFAAGADYILSGGPAVVRIATDQLGLTGVAIPAGPVNITGILIQSDLSNPAGVGINYRLEPRGPEDIVSVPEPATLLLVGLGGLLLRKQRAGR
jgi:hypothetical protein